MKDPRLYLLHIAECIAKIARYTAAGATAMDEPMVADAVLRNLQTLSEAAQRLPDDVKARHPEIPWQRIAGFRNILVHDYLGGIDNSLVWRVIQDELPRLKAVIEAELAA
ncbi:conserved hypothetical protein [Magnetospirillum sp. LM-5]|uniref:HepT-like ribonuclease domain-containing protein n=1 Tax=Magnetospirillum sp. LM-5 TaxID=2681466 RepID=UPI001380F820|nr:HepT-like ribonuclease domain-containing protein [Magnetospirillum sp. LM-5]CAA7624914.1 conserved hypothetical protein [Magnetospirillum sp. LM-5]